MTVRLRPTPPQSPASRLTSRQQYALVRCLCGSAVPRATSEQHGLYVAVYTIFSATQPTASHHPLQARFLPPPRSRRSLDQTCQERASAWASLASSLTPSAGCISGLGGW